MKQSTLMYKSGRLPRLYFVCLIAVAMPVFVGIMIFKDLDVFFEEYRSRTSGILWMVAMLISSNVIWVCMLWLSGRYILQIEQIDEETIAIKTWSAIGWHKTRNHSKKILQTQQFYPGRSIHWGAPSVNAPYSIIKTERGKKLLLDEQGEFFTDSKATK